MEIKDGIFLFNFLFTFLFAKFVHIKKTSLYTFFRSNIQKQLIFSYIDLNFGLN
jgi:hypothetical protein